ncbi:spermatogenesis-associated protein 17 isoform X2 [Engystomops pustulosus]|uniref:spermatogenesis-associated protein 17 isoform X2 n=1 Tax=Engystomops pustulosus TaxID=76066 RepID=UPI003AFADC08
MATLGKLQRRLSELTMEYFQRCRDAEENRLTEYNAAVVIQSWFRGCRVRAYLRYLNRMVTVIQKWWRGYRARKYFRSKVKIQKRWRGYYIRKYVHNYYALKKYLEGVAIKNSFVRKELEEFAEMSKKEKQKKALDSSEREKEQRARKMHHLLSTEQIPGIYNSPYRQYPDEMEFRLKRARPPSHRELPKKDHDGSFVDWTDCRPFYSFPTTQPLPPIGQKKPQGPFRDPAEVFQQRYRPLEPTLRVATSFNSLEEAREELKRQEWRKGFQEESFAPFSSFHKNKRYEPLLHASTEYKQIPPSTQRFRDDDQVKWVSQKDFQTIFTPIPLFDKYGRTYSKAGQAV